MRVLNPKVSLDDFFQQLGEASERALLLDYDGTLAPFQEDRYQAHPYPGVLDKINHIMNTPGNRVVIISGRWTRDLKTFLKLERQPEIWGSHGIERLREDGRYEVEEMEEKPLRGLAEADEWVEEYGFAEYCEAKPGCLALHWRTLDRATIRKIRQELKPEWSRIAKRRGLSFREFDGGLELRVPGRNKGDAVATVLTELKKQDAAAAYLGDDLTDEDAFRALRAVRASGAGRSARRGYREGSSTQSTIGILVRRELRDTNADVWIKPPHELLQFLSNWETMTGGQNGNSQ